MCSTEDDDDVEALFNNLDRVQIVFGIIYLIIYSIGFCITLFYSIYEYYSSKKPNEKHEDLDKVVVTTKISTINSTSETHIERKDDDENDENQNNDQPITTSKTIDIADEVEGVTFIFACTFFFCLFSSVFATVFCFFVLHYRHRW